MQRRSRIVVAAGTAVVALGLAGAAAVRATTSDDDDDQRPITGTELERASAAALAHTGEGRVTETEVGDEDSYYEVEVTLDDGTQVDVQLDKGFNVVNATDDVEGDDGAGDD